MRILLATYLMLLGSLLADHNILVIMLDDMGNDFTSLNTDATASIPPTPNLDSLAANGIRFTEFRTQQACAMSRASFLTGRYPFRTDVVQNSDPLPAAEYTIADDLKANHGYTAGMVGKWNLGGISDNDYPRTYGGFDYFAGSYTVSSFAVTSHFSWNKTINGGEAVASTNYITTEEVDDAIAWTGSATEPWFCYLALHAAHTAGGINQYPPSELHSYEGTPGADGGVTAYRAMIEATDTELGRLLATVNYADTIVVFMADNGSSFTNGSIPANRIKGYLYDNAVKSPLIIRSPGMTGAGTSNNTKINIVDIYPTLVKLATGSAAASTNTLDGVDLSGVFRGEVVPLRPAQYATDGTDRSACDGTYRLLDKASGSDEFYKVGTDPFEQADLGTVGLTGQALKAYNNLRYALEGFTNKTGEQAVIVADYDTTPTVAGNLTITSGGITVIRPTRRSPATIEAPLKSGATTYTLWKRANPFDSWVNTGLSPTVGSTVVFTDPAPSGRVEYRITNNAPEP